MISPNMVVGPTKMRKKPFSIHECTKYQRCPENMQYFVLKRGKEECATLKEAQICNKVPLNLLKQPKKEGIGEKEGKNPYKYVVVQKVLKTPSFNTKTALKQC